MDGFFFRIFGFWTDSLDATLEIDTFPTEAETEAEGIPPANEQSFVNERIEPRLSVEVDGSAL